MYHYTYKVYTKSGKYYVGRHSTEDLDDGYVGSGKWVRGIEDKNILEKEILHFYNSFEELKSAEECLITEHINKPNNMNFNDSAVGFASGNLNPANSPTERKRRSDRSKGDNNPAKRPEVRKKMSESQKGRPSPRKGKSMPPEFGEKISKSRQGIKYSEEGRKKLSESRKLQFINGERTPPSAKGHKHSEENIELFRKNALERERVECPHCKNHIL